MANENNIADELAAAINDNDTLSGYIIDDADPNLDTLMDEAANVRKVFPYFLPGVDENQAFIKQNTTSIVALENSIFGKMKQDKGKFYFELYTRKTQEDKIVRSSGVKTSGENYETIEKIQGFAISVPSWKPVLPCFYTIGSPFNKKDYEAGAQKVYAREMSNVSKETDDDPELLDRDGLVIFNLKDISELYKEIKGVKFLLHETEKQLRNPMLDKTNQGITISTNAYSPLSRISAKGITSDGTTDITFETDQKMVYLKGTPTNTKGKTALYLDFFDYDVCLPYFTAVKFAESNTLNQALLNKEDEELILDMLALSTAYTNSFRDFKLLDSSKQGAAGKIDPTEKIGYSKISVAQLQGITLKTATDNLYNSWKKDEVIDETSDRAKVVKSIITALSRDIISSLSIAGGGNQFNSVVLPWYLIPSGNLTLNSKKQISKSKKFKLKTNFFKISKKQLLAKDKFEITNQRVVQSDRKITLPQVPDIIKEIDKLPFPADYDTNSNKDLQFMWAISIDSQEDFAKFMLNKNKISTNLVNKEKDFDSDPNVVYLPIFNKTVFIQQNAAQRFQILKDINTRIKVLDEGTIEEETLPVQEITLVANPSANAGTWNPTTPDWAQGTSLSGTPSSTGSFPWEDDDIGIIIANYLGLPQGIILEPISIVGQRTYDPTSSNLLYADSWVAKIKWRPKRQKIINARIVVQGEITEIKYDERRVLFDKEQFVSLLSGLDLLKKNRTEHKLKIINKRPIEKITEIEIASMWGNNVIIYLNGISFKIPLVNQKDESVAVERIIFT